MADKEGAPATAASQEALFRLARHLSDQGKKHDEITRRLEQLSPTFREFMEEARLSDGRLIWAKKMAAPPGPLKGAQTRSPASLGESMGFEKPIASVASAVLGLATLGSVALGVYLESSLPFALALFWVCIWMLYQKGSFSR